MQNKELIDWLEEHGQRQYGGIFGTYQAGYEAGGTQAIEKLIDEKLSIAPIIIQPNGYGVIQDEDGLGYYSLSEYEQYGFNSSDFLEYERSIESAKETFNFINLTDLTLKVFVEDTCVYFDGRSWLSKDFSTFFKVEPHSSNSITFELDESGS